MPVEATVIRMPSPSPDPAAEVQVTAVDVDHEVVRQKDAPISTVWERSRVPKLRPLMVARQLPVTGMLNTLPLFEENGSTGWSYVKEFSAVPTNRAWTARAGLITMERSAPIG